MKIAIVAASAANTRAIGRNGTLPWRLKKELQYFKVLTSSTDASGFQNAIVMGRKTWDSLPTKAKPLPNRINIVLSSTLHTNDLPDGVILARSLSDAMEEVSKREKIERVFIVGGHSIFSEALSRKLCDELYLTQVYADFDGCDVFFPEIPPGLFCCRGTPPMAPMGRQKEGEIEYEMFYYERIQPVAENGKVTCDVAENNCANLNSKRITLTNSRTRHPEYQYLDLIRFILDNGHEKTDRTGTGTRSIFGESMRFSLRDNTLPLLTTKRVFWRGVAEELLWFISGNTNANVLQEKGINIWKGNGSREYLDSIGLTQREEGDLGPVYGFQWRHFGADYKDMHTDYSGCGVDQLAQLIEKLKNSPNDRRLIISAWNPAAFRLMALPPCHMFAQFYVVNNELSCQMYQRSADMGLGVPFNIASYALLTHLLAKCTGLVAGEFIHVIGDCHVYLDHIEPLRTQLLRTPRPFPKLKINTENTEIDGFKFSDFELVDYKPHGSIKMTMSV